MNDKDTESEKDLSATDSKLEKQGIKASQISPDTELETGGPQGLEPTRYGDWERKGRCVDF